MLFLSDLSHKECSTYTTSQQRSRFTNGSRRRERVFADNKHTMETGHQMCRTRDRTASRVRGKDQHMCAEKLNICSHFTECAEKPADASRTSPSARRTGSNKFRTSQSTRMDQTKDSALFEVRKRHGFPVQSARTQNLFSAGFTKR